MIFGYALVIVGVYFLLKELGILPAISWDYIWPSLLILWGLTIIFRRDSKWLWRCCFPHRGEEEKKP